MTQAAAGQTMEKPVCRLPSTAAGQTVGERQAERRRLPH